MILQIKNTKTDDENSSFGKCLSEESFWVPDYMPSYISGSGWIEHGPFAFWLIQAHRPNVFIELGTHQGYSYLSFCQAVKHLGVGTHCYAVDTWEGDKHAGFYGEEIFECFSKYHNAHYSDFSQLKRMTFDDAVNDFEDNSVDLLHIDGRHYYDDVRHDFEIWKSKLSNRAVVVFHDICVLNNDFGVFKFWSELKEKYPYFEFTHGNGLGVLGVGTSLSKAMHALFAASENKETAVKIQEAYSRLGSAITDRLVLTNHNAKTQLMLTNHNAEIQQLKEELSERSLEIQKLGLRMNKILSSNSWKLTVPLRLMRKHLSLPTQHNCD